MFQPEHSPAVGKRPGPLEGVRVLDLSRLLPGPFCSLLLADMGAEVVKVEEPGQGDYTRWMPPLVDGISAAFVALNRGKKSVTLDLKNGEARAALLRMLEHFDVLLETFRPGVMARLGLDYATVSAHYPRLVYCSISGYGNAGPLRERAGHDINYLALGGVLGATGPRDRAPELAPVQIADVAGGAYPAALSIVSALFERQRTGVGRYLDISMTDGALAMLTMQLAGYLASGSSMEPGELMLSGGMVNYGAYRTADQQVMALGALEPHFWLRFLAAVGRTDLSGAIGLTGPEREAARAELQALFASRTRAEWVELFAELDVCCEPALTADEVVHHPLHWMRGMIREVAGTSEPPIRTVATPLPFGREAILEGRAEAIPALEPAPGLGAHGEEVLQRCGFSAAEIERLRAVGGL